MAKMKTFAVDVEIVLKRTVYVEARRPGGATEKILTREGLLDVTRYSGEDEIWDSVIYGSGELKVSNVKVVG